MTTNYIDSNKKYHYEDHIYIINDIIDYNNNQVFELNEIYVCAHSTNRKNDLLSDIFRNINDVIFYKVNAEIPTPRWPVSLDTDQDGIWDIYEYQDPNNPSVLRDTDHDGFPNFCDPDDDGDGILTIFEGADPNGDGNPDDAQDSHITSSAPRLADYLDIDDDHDGIPTKDEDPDPNKDGNPDDAQDINGDGDPDYHSGLGPRINPQYSAFTFARNISGNPIFTRSIKLSKQLPP